MHLSLYSELHITCWVTLGVCSAGAATAAATTVLLDIDWYYLLLLMTFRCKLTACRLFNLWKENLNTSHNLLFVYLLDVSFYYLYTYPVMNAGIQFHASILVTSAVMCHAVWKFEMGQLPAQACLWSWHIFTSALQNLCYACNKCLILPSCWSTINIIWTRSLS